MCSSSDHNITSCPYYVCYAPPNFASLRDKTDVVLTLHDSSLPLTQCTRIEVGEPFRFARFDEVNAREESEDTFDVAHNLVDTPSEGCRDTFVHEGSLSVGCDDVSPNLLDHSYVAPVCLQPSFSSDYSFDMPNDIFKLCDSNMDLGCDDNMLNVLGGNDKNFEPLGYFSGYDASLDPHYINLVDKPRKILSNILFAFSFDFSIAFALIKRELTLFALIFCMLSYCQAWKSYAEEFDKLLLRALTVFSFNSRVLKKC